MRLNSMNKFVLSAGLLSSVSVVALAQESAEVSDPIEEITVSASRIERPLSHVGSSVTVIERDDILRRQELTMADLLRDVPGVSMSRNGGYGGVTSVRLRGADAGQTMVLINGIKINDLSSPTGGTNFANIFTAGMGRIEVLRGPQSTLYGSDAMGGVIALETDTTDDGFGGHLEGGSRATISAGAHARASGDRWSAGLFAGHLSSDGISAADEADGNTEKDGYNSTSFMGTARVELLEDINLSGFVRMVNSKADIDAYDFLVGGYADADDAEDTEDGQWGLTLDATFMDGAFDNRLTVSWANIDRANFTAGDKSFEAFSRRRSIDYLGHGRVNEMLSLVFGAELEKNEISTESFGPWASREEGNADINSVFGEVIFTPQDALSLTFGVRNDDHSAFGSQMNVRGTASYNLAATDTLIRASWGQGFKAPTLYQLYSAYGNVDLKPETSEGWDVGVEQDLGHVATGLKATATWFSRNTDQQIDFDFATFRYANLEQTLVEGLEVALNLDGGDNWGLDASYTYMDATDQGTGLALLRRPEHSYNVSGFVAVGQDMELSATISHVGRQQDVGVELAGFTVIDARWSWQMRDGMELYARIENMFDEQYQQVAGFGTPGRSLFAGIRVSM